MIPGVADQKYLLPFYDAVSAAIRQVDQSHVIMFAGVTWDDFGVGFERVPESNSFTNMSALAYHFYIPPQFSLNETMVVRMKDLKRLQCGGFLTEFGIGDDDGTSPSALQDMINTMNAMDAHFQSWAGWEYKMFDPITGFGDSVWFPNSTLNVPVCKIISRTYPQVVGGHTLLISYEDSTATFNLQYGTLSPSLCSPITVIYLNEKLNYPNGFSVTLSSSAHPGSSSGIQYVNSGMNTIEITTNATILPENTIVYVSISRK